MPRQKNTKPTSIYWLYDMRPEKVAARGELGEPFYCGKTVQKPGKRLREHQNDPSGNMGPRVQECGENIRMATVETVSPNNDWCARERWWIYTMRLLYPGCCLNVSDGGEGAPGCIRTPESIEKTSAAKRGKRLSPEHRAKISAAHIGKKLSPEHRAKMSASMRGKIHSNETRAKISASLTGERHSLETRIKIGLKSSAALRGRKKSPEHIEKIAAANRGRPLSPEHRAKISDARMGAKLSNEHRAKLIAANKRRKGTKLSNEHRAKISAAMRSVRSVATPPV